jgi:hypothetical protein
MADKPSWRELTPGERDELTAGMGSRGWRIVLGEELPRVFPESFREKITSAVRIVEPTSTGGQYLAYSAERIDARDGAVDIEPFGVIVHSTGAGPSGVFVHHGDWSGRTRPLPPDLCTVIASSEVRNYIGAVPPSGRTEGTLDELPLGHRGAFDAVVRRLRAREDGGE